MKSKKKSPKPRIYKKRGGKEIDYDLDGPLDTLYHSYVDKEHLKQHVKDLKTRKDELEKKLEEEKLAYDDIEDEIAKINKDDKRKDEEQQKSNEEKEEKSKLYEQKNSNNALTSIKNGFISAKDWIIGLWTEFKNLVYYLGVFIKNLWDKLISRIAAKIGDTAAGIIDRIVKGLGEALRLFLKMIILPLLFLVIIIVLIWYGFTIFTRKSNQSSSADGSTKHTFEFNISGLGNLFSMPTIDKSFLDTSALKKLVFPIPQYESIIPKYDDMELSIWDKMVADLSNWFKTNPVTSAASDGANMFLNATGSLFGGGTRVDPVLRQDNINGRIDNKAFFETKYINPELLKEKKFVKENENIEYNQTALSIALPEDLEWSFDSKFYETKDIKKVPDPLLADTFDKQNIIIIPWERDDYDSQYKLKCDNAYFKGSKEKANILINSTTENNTCVFNNNQKPVVYKDTKERDTNAGDLSIYTPLKV
jgi:hypothetical protein